MRVLCWQAVVSSEGNFKGRNSRRNCRKKVTEMPGLRSQREPAAIIFLRNAGFLQFPVSIWGSSSCQLPNELVRLTLPPHQTPQTVQTQSNATLRLVGGALPPSTGLKSLVESLRAGAPPPSSLVLILGWDLHCRLRAGEAHSYTTASTPRCAGQVIL